ncbi:MAG: hypothetical protein ACOCSH_00360 [Candidatus Hadarchaeota archaeon]
MVGIIYSLIYINSFISSTKSSSVMKRVRNLPRALNLLFYLFSGIFILVGFFFWIEISILSIFAFFLLYTLNNLRRPMVVSFFGEKIESQKRATLMSAESQLRSIFGMVFAPILGFAADSLGIGVAFVMGGLALAILGKASSIQEKKV